MSHDLNIIIYTSESQTFMNAVNFLGTLFWPS